MRIKILIFILFIFTTIGLHAQKNRKTPKFHLGVELNTGTTFANFTSPQEKWTASYYGYWSGSLSILMRMNKHWSGDLGIGMAAYTMLNKKPGDYYLLDFASPYLFTGLQYAYPIQLKSEAFFGLGIGVQQGYQGELYETFSDYTVVASSRYKGYYWGNLKMGIRKELRLKSKKTGQYSCEFGTFFRYNLNGLGKAEFFHQDNYVEVLEPRGHVLGIFFKLLVPTSTSKVKITNKIPEKPPIIYHPRM